MNCKFLHDALCRIPLLALYSSLPLASCATSHHGAARVSTNSPQFSVAAAKSAVPETSQSENHERLRIYQASQTIQVADVSAATKAAEEAVRNRKGFIETSSIQTNGNSHASMTVRVPASAQGTLLDEFASFGNETNRRISAEDTTGEYYDLQARLKNTEALRDRLRGLLNATDSISEILKIEKELARVQTDLDAMRTRFQRMQSQVRLSKIDLTLRTKEIPGPLGAAGKGLWWSIRKLFVLQ